MKKILLLVATLPILFLANTTLALSADNQSNGYIVVLKDDSSEQETVDLPKRHKLISDFQYSKSFKGFAARFTKEKLKELKNDPRVAFISEDKIVSIDRVTTQAVQTVPTGWGRVEASSAANTGSGIGVAVIDTGIDLTHPDLKTNIVANKNCVRSFQNANDDNGHGSHVAGTIAAINNSVGSLGVAPEAKLIAVKVLNAKGSGTWSQVICGIDWVTANAARYNIKVANMSLGGGGISDNNCGNTNFDALHKAICRARDAGVTFTVAAGNSNADATFSVPAAYDDAVITVSALADSDGKRGGLGGPTSYGPDDTFASFSNYGGVVDIGAPGTNIYSTYRNGGYATLSGTSMATPHVAGAAVVYIKLNPGLSWSQVRDGLKSAGEVLDSGHTDPSGKHPEPVVRVSGL